MNIDGVVELRVHGVSGTPATELLDRPVVVQWCGDRRAGFYRPGPGLDPTDSYQSDTEPVRGPLLEGYVWGGLTSGAPSRAFWLLLLPFTLINVAPRLRPVGSGWHRAAIWYLCRVLALALTIGLTGGLIGVGIDLIGWQCSAASGRCGAAGVGWLTGRSTAHRIAIGSLLPLAGLALLWVLSRTTFRRYEQTAAIHPTTDDPRLLADADGTDDALPSRWMWDNEHRVSRLRTLHLQTGVGVVLAGAASPLAGWRWVDGAIAGGLVIIALVLLARPAFTGHRPAQFGQLLKCIWVVLALACLVTGFVLLRPGTAVLRRTAGLPGFGAALVWLLLAEVLVVGILAVVVVLAGRRQVPACFGTGPTPAALRATGTVVLALVAVFLAAVFTAGAYLLAAALLAGGPLIPRFGAISSLPSRFAVPEAVYDAGLAYSVSVVVAVLAVLAAIGWILWSLARVSPSSRLVVPGSYPGDYPDQPQRNGSNRRRRSILRAFWLGRLVDRAGVLLGVLVAIGGLLTAGFAAVLLAEHALGLSGPARWLLDRSGHLGVRRHLGVRETFGGITVFSRIGLQASGAYLAVASLIGLVVLGAVAFRKTSTRRSVGILWDLASFWPRASHPLAAPCYAERTVPDLVGRTAQFVGEGTGVVLAAHSQGTVIAVAAIEQLVARDTSAEPDDAVLGRVALLTCGCVLRRLYLRYFPAYFGPATPGQIAAALDGPDGVRWWNLWRWTDYLGGPVLSGPPPAPQPPWDGSPPALREGPADLHLLDPPFALELPPGHLLLPKPGRHSGFWRVREFQCAAAGLARLLPVRAAPPTPSGPGGPST